MFFVYGRYKTRDAAERSLENSYAFGDVFPSEFHSIAKNGDVWELRLRAD